jgi:hypothetical protein
MKSSLHHWPELLADFIARRQNAPFVWGKNDCCLFACDAVFEMTGFDLAGSYMENGFRGGYDSALSAVKAMRAFAGPDCETDKLVGAVAEKIAAQHSIQEIPVLMAQRGDVVLLLAQRGESLGIIGLRGDRALAPGPEGIESVPLDQCLKAWRIPKC